MSDLNATLIAVLTDRFKANAARVRELADSLKEEEFWTRPFAHGNSCGHLLLHLAGNLNYYIGAQIAGTGYVRDRPREFHETNLPSKEQALRRFDDAVSMVIDAIHQQTSEDWSRPYSAVGTHCCNRLDMVIQCAAHMQHHIGQMIYLSSEWERQSGGM